MSRRKAPAAPLAFEPPTQPPKTPEEIAHSISMAEGFRRLAAELRAENLANAVLLAQQAACGQGPLVDHFRELSRRYSHLLKPASKLTRGDLRVVEGGNV